jgi:hypothetical protein
MKQARLNLVGVATPSIADSFSVIASGAKQSSALVGQSGLLRRFAPRNDGTGFRHGNGLPRCARNDGGVNV